MTQKLAAAPEALEVAFVPTIDDHVQVLLATIDRGRRRWWAPAVMVVVLLANVVIGVWRHGAAALFGEAGVFLLILVLGTAAYLGRPVIARMIYARRAKREPGLTAPVAFRFGRDGVRVKDGGGVTLLSWNDVAGVRETRDLFYVEIGRDISLYVPRRALEAGDQARLRTLLKARLGARARVHETNGR